MKAFVDKFGRVVIPLRLRHLLGIRAGTPLEIEAGSSELRLKVVEATPSVVKEDGVLVYVGEVKEGDIAKALHQQREERLKSISGTSLS